MPLPDQHLGISPPSSTRLVGLLVVTVTLCVAGASQLTYAKKEYVDGYLQSAGGDLRVAAPARGVVRYAVRAGERVSAGQALARLDANEHLAEGGTLREAEAATLAGKRSSVQAELAGSLAALGARTQALQSQQALAQAAVRQAHAEVASRQQFLLLEQRKLARQGGLRAQGFISAPAVEQAEADVLARQAELLAAERAVTQAESSLAAVQAEQAAHASATGSVRQQLQRELLTLQQAGTQSRRDAGVTVVAPRPGAVAARATAEGDIVEAGQLLLRLAPSGASLEAVLLLPPAAAGRVVPGQAVALQLSAYPYQSYGLVQAQVTRVDTAPLLAGEAGMLRQAGLPAGAVVVAATARLTEVPAAIGKAALKSGMPFKAAVEVERKSFLAWMTAPLLKHFQ